MNLVKEGGITAARDGADSVDIVGGARHVEVAHYQHQRRPHPQILVHVMVVRLQEGVTRQRCLLL